VRACAKVAPESVISHTLVTGGSVLGLVVLVGVVVAGVVVFVVGFDVEIGVAVAKVELLVVARLRSRRRLFLVGVASALTDGGWTGLTALCAALLAAIRASELISTGRLGPARDALGAGPIAAPTATPRASIPAASIAVAREEGRRGGPLGAGGVGVSGGLGNGQPGLGWSRWVTRTGVPGHAFFIN
jgi:hypothetical protein